MTTSVLKWQYLGLTFPVDQHSTGPWMQQFAQAPSSLRLGDDLRIFFATRSNPDSQYRYVSRIGWVDVSPDDPTRVREVSPQPVMDVGGRGEFDEFGTYPFSAIPHKDGFLAAYAGWTRLVSVPFDTSIGLAFSPDGNSFSRMGNGPVLSGSPHEPFILSGPKLRRFDDHLFLFYIAGRRWISCNSGLEPVYRIRMAVSSDGLHWQRLNRELIPPSLGDDEAQASPDVFRRGDSYFMVFSFRAGCDFRNGPGSYRLGLARSTNLLDWERIDDRLGFSGSGESWDSQMQAYAHWFESANGDPYLAYLGNQVGKAGFGLARLTHWPEDL